MNDPYQLSFEETHRDDAPVPIDHPPPEKETWAKLHGFPKYWISTHGRILSYMKRIPEYLTKRVNQSGYQYVLVRKDGKTHNLLVNRHVLLNHSLKPPCDHPEDLQANHKDRNKLNNHLSNLEWSDKYDNTKHWRKVKKPPQEHPKPNGHTHPKLPHEPSAQAATISGAIATPSTQPIALLLPRK